VSEPDVALTGCPALTPLNLQGIVRLSLFRAIYILTFSSHLWFSLGMLALNSLHNIISRPLCRSTIALIQLVVMVMLSVPACCYESAPEQAKSGMSLSSTASGTDHDECPCCPENGTAGDDCSTCSSCSLYAPLTSSGLSVDCAPSVARLISREPFNKLLEVNLPIFVPPQNLA